MSASWEVSSGYPLTVMTGDEQVAVCKDEATAALVAAAPELHQALLGMLALYDAPVFHDGDHEIAKRARAAIAKAGGK